MRYKKTSKHKYRQMVPVYGHADILLTLLERFLNDLIQVLKVVEPEWCLLLQRQFNLVFSQLFTSL